MGIEKDVIDIFVKKGQTETERDRRTCWTNRSRIFYT